MRKRIIGLCNSGYMYIEEIIFLHVYAVSVKIKIHTNEVTNDFIRKNFISNNF